MRVAKWERAAVAVVVGVQLYLASLFWFMTDDAYISFRYSKNWAEGHGVRYNIGEHTPVEGYSNFLWVALAAVVEFFGGDVTLWMPVLSMALASITLLWMFRACRDTLQWSAAGSFAAMVALALSPGFVVWSTGGLATMAEACFLFILAERMLLGRGAQWPIAALAGISLALVRTEGIAWFGVTMALAVILAVAEKEHRRQLVRAIGATVASVGVVFAAYYLWRFNTYGTLVSNTAAAKVGLSVEQVERGLDYVSIFWMEAIATPMMMAMVPALWSLARWRGLLMGALAFGPTAYAIIVGGDFMTMGRLLVPGLAFIALALGAAVELGWRSQKQWVGGAAVALIVLNVLPMTNIQLVPEEIRERARFRWNTREFRSEYEQWEFMRINGNRWRKFGEVMLLATTPGESLVLGAIGAVGYHSNLFIYDRYGLVTREVAMRELKRTVEGRSPGHDKEVSPAFFLEDEPTYMRAELLGQRRMLKTAAGEVKSWRVKDSLKEHYAPEIRSAVVDGLTYYVVLLSRTDEADKLWEEWPRPVQVELARTREE